MQDNIVANVTTIITNADGTSFSSPLLIIGAELIYAETKDLDLGNPAREKYLDRIRFDLEAPAEVPSMVVRIGYRNKLSDPLVWTEELQLSLPNPEITPRISAKFFRLKFSDDFPLTQWKLSKIEFYGQLMHGRL